ncbi:polyisoprenoid-binding protein [Lentzea pudingi]|uniref:Polyisoprenoid-binding protein n=1 Tax=Lentzea pudingi TaxID=1789439 RepID=A0ABQ2IRY9_9PSEU|nr:YceI family protein [Lentzea pudingi]GGN28667.1 polyisoprenoid-binding protein [Lentzea pudingi]
MSLNAKSIVGTFAADPAHSSFTFAVKHMTISLFRASFDDVEAQVVASEDGIRFEGAVRVESVSIRTPAEFRDKVVNGADFFDGKNHPEMKFRSTDVELRDDGTAIVDGELTIKGITKPFKATGTYELPVEDPFGGTRAAIALEATVDRREWGLTWQMPLPKGGDALAYEVRLIANVALTKTG